MLGVPRDWRRGGFAEVDRAASAKELPCGYATVLAGETEAQSSTRYEGSRPHGVLGRADAQSRRDGKQVASSGQPLIPKKRPKRWTRRKWGRQALRHLWSHHWARDLHEYNATGPMGMLLTGLPCLVLLVSAPEARGLLGKNMFKNNPLPNSTSATLQYPSFRAPFFLFLSPLPPPRGMSQASAADCSVVKSRRCFTRHGATDCDA
jgi:hypothetical protein